MIAAIVGFLVVIITSSFHEIAAQLEPECALSVEEWQKIKDNMSVRNFTNEFLKAGDCDINNVDGLLAKYRACTSTLAQVVTARGLEPNSSCEAAMETSLTLTGNPYAEGEKSALATRICTSAPLGNTLTDDQRSSVRGYFCVPVFVFGCPSGVDILTFATFASCHVTALNGKSDEFINNYFATGADLACMRGINVCKVFKIWESCPITVNQTLSYLSTDQKYTCDNMFPLHPGRCLMTFQEQQEFYCPDPTFLEANIYAIAISCSLGPLAALVCFILYCRMYRSGYITDDDIMKQAIVAPTSDMEFGSSPYNTNAKTVHPELHHVLKKSKYKGVKFDSATGSWYVEGMQRMFVNEKEAAQQAYLQNVEYHVSAPVSYKRPKLIVPEPGEGPPGLDKPAQEYIVYLEPTQAEEDPEEQLIRRKAQLNAFYAYWDAEKPDIKGHVNHLFERHDFKYIMRALKTKYGIVPPGWEDEVMDLESRI